MILVTGATGNVGRELVTLLHAAGAPVRGLTRGPSATDTPGIELRSGNLDEPATLGNALDGVTAMFLLDGYRDMPGIVEAARAAGVARVVLLSSGCTVGGNPANAITRFHLAAEAAVRASPLAWTILQPSGFMSNVLRWLPQLRAGDEVRMPFADVPIAAIDPRDIAAVAAAALLREGHAGRSYLLTGPEALLPTTQLALLAHVLARPLRAIAQTDTDARRGLEAAHWPPAMIDALFRFYVDGEYDDSIVRHTVRELAGRPARTFVEWAEQHRSAFA